MLYLFIVSFSVFFQPDFFILQMSINKHMMTLSKHPFLLFISVFLCYSCHQETKTTQNKSAQTCDQVEQASPVNVMLTSYSTTVFPGDTSLLRVAITDSLAREITRAKDSIRILVDTGVVLLDENQNQLILKADTAGMYYTDLFLEGIVKCWFIAPNEGFDKIKVEAQALNIYQSAEKIWPGSHEIHILPANFQDLQPTKEQFNYQSGKKLEKMMGADVSFIPQTDADGRTFKLNGEEVDPLNLLSETGFNAIRLRLFVNPELQNGYAPETGFCGLEKTLEFAKRVKANGFKILLDFHYSDYWADPQKQFKPKAWEDLGFEELSQTLEEYTYEVMVQFKSEGVSPDMVQIGNEINHGMVWPDGHISNPDQLAELLRAGIRGVERANASTPIMLHVALGGQNIEAVRWYNNMIARDVQFDIIGLSFYPRWHGTLKDLKFNINDLIERYHRPINIVEYNWYKKCVNELVFSLPSEYQSGSFVWEPLHWQTDMADYKGNLNEAVIQLYEELAKKHLN